MEGTSSRLNGLDHLRALAIILVFIYHYRAFGHPAWVDNYGRFGWIGVDLFFVLSGFLISSQLFKRLINFRNISLKEFYIKRFFRIIPPFIVVIILYFFFPFFREREALRPLWKFLTFTQNFELDVINFGTFSHAWSLCIEEQFYIFLPLFLILIYRLNGLKKLSFFLLCILVLVIIIRALSWQEFIIPNLKTESFWKEWYMKIYYPTYTRLDGLLIGVLIGYFSEYSPKFKNYINARGNHIFCFSIVALGLTLWICNNQVSQIASIIGFSCVAISFGLLVVASISESSTLARSKTFITSHLAGLSYVIYLTHKGVIHITQNILEDFGVNKTNHFTLLICAITCIITAILFRYIIEKPSSKIKNQILKSLK